MTITFAKPPVIEVMVGQVFVPRPDFLVPHFGILWSALRDRYPRCAHSQPIFSEPEGFLLDASAALLPRVWFLTQDDTSIVQVQQDRLYVNWRQVTPNTTYARFPSVKDEYDRVWGTFVKTLTELTGAAPQRVRLEMAYVNIIPSGDGWKTAAEIGNVLRDFSWTPGSRYLSAPNAIQGQLTLSGPAPKSKATVKIDTLKRAGDDTPALRLEIQVVGVPEDGQSDDSWIEAAHLFIVNGFKDLTTDAMHKQWELK